MNTNKTTARIVGALFLVAMVASLAGGLWLESMATGDYLETLAGQETQVLLGVLLELINCLSVIGIAAALFPLMKKLNGALAAGYLGIRIIEATILSLAAIGPLLLVTLSQEYLAAGPSDAALFQTAGALVIAARGHLASLLTPIFFSLAALLLYYFFYRSRLVPRFISIWGFIAVVALLTWNMLEAFGMSISIGMVFALPMILNEIFMGFWLLVRGFDSP